jgi:hypothetical protein
MMAVVEVGDVRMRVLESRMAMGLRVQIAGISDLSGPGMT